MVCSVWSVKMTALARLVDARSLSQTATEQVSYQKLAAQYIDRELRDADEANLLDDEDMHIFGLSPMTDPLDLVCCNACKKPIKASQYAVHAELCKSLISSMGINLELDGPAVTRKPPRKERKKSQNSQPKKAILLREPKKFESLNSGDIATQESHIDESIPMSSFTEAPQDPHLNSTHKLNGLTVNTYNVDSLKGVTKHSLIPLKRTAAENPSNASTKNLCKTAPKILPYVPAPLATKTYYSQRNHRLQSAISRMFFEETGKELSNEFPPLADLQVNATLGQTSPGVSLLERVACQQRDGNSSNLARTPDQILSPRSNCYMVDSGAFVPSETSAAQLPVNNTLAPHYISNSYSFADKPGKPLDNLQQGNESVPVL